LTKPGFSAASVMVKRPSASRRSNAASVTPKVPPGCKPRTCLADIDRAAHLDAAQLLGIALMLPAQHREFLVHPDVDAARPRCVPWNWQRTNDEHFLVLHAHRIEDLRRIVGWSIASPPRSPRPRPGPPPPALKPSGRSAAIFAGSVRYSSVISSPE